MRLGLFAKSLANEKMTLDSQRLIEPGLPSRDTAEFMPGKGAILALSLCLNWPR